MPTVARPPGDRRARGGKKQTVQKHPNDLAIARQLLKRFHGRDDYVAVGSDTGARLALTAKRLASRCCNAAGRGAEDEFRLRSTLVEPTERNRQSQDVALFPPPFTVRPRGLREPACTKSKARASNVGC
jgi:hypothetical protein